MSDELVEVWRQRDGTWRWRYLVVEDHRELRSNRGYESVEQAVRSARQAYPGVHVLGPAEHPTSLDGARREARMLRIVAASAAAAFVLLALWSGLRRARRRVSRGG